MTDFVPSKEHLALIKEVESYVTKWQPRLPWLDGWSVKVRPEPPGEGSWTMHIETGSYVKSAIISVRENANTADARTFMEDDYSVELVVIHELCHVCVEPLRNVFWNWTTEDGMVPEPAHLAITDAEEPCVWAMCRALLRLEQEKKAKRAA